MRHEFLFEKFHHLSFFHIDLFLLSVVVRCSDFYLVSTRFIKKETLAQVFSCEFCEISKNTFFTEHLWAAASLFSFMMNLIFGFFHISNFVIIIFTLLFPVILIYNLVWLWNRCYPVRSIVYSRTICGIYSDGWLADSNVFNNLSPSIFA